MLQPKMPQLPRPNSRRRVLLLTIAALSFSIASCGGGGNTGGTAAGGGETSPAGSSSSPAASTSSSGGNGANVSLLGTGGTFPQPLYQTWFTDYSRKNPGVRITYQALGSAAGIQQFTQNLVDFGASDVAMTDQQIAKVQRGVVLLPMTAGAIVIAYNVAGVPTGLKLSRQVYPAIFLGTIKNWNDPRIAKDNPGVKLPNLPITVVHRSEGSGTTGAFTGHLSAIDPTWKSQVGAGTTVNWPTGVGAKGNAGVTQLIKQTNGSIGYVEYGYAETQKVPFAQLQNKAGKYVEATLQTASNTLSAVTLPADLRAFITDPSGANSYPIVTYTWLLAYKKYDNANKAKVLKDVINYGLTQGQKDSARLGYVPLPSNVVSKVQAAANTIQP
ncbi:MAG: phosphate ABC transporter substrate-binding protein PstS [Chroococcidiopsidaceae cyanobacterium CP_BM_ER_R8_30]|nr:phosphate ABC transporter substrate-binding protein PstS [Chroococcidiopsidaceae cyanobacterium CP_BM_ER_R8_30]